MPVFTPSLDLFTELRAFRRAVLGAAEIAADYAAVMTQDRETGAYDTEDDNDQEYKAFSRVPIARRMLTTLPPGAQMSQFDAKQPTTTYDMFQEKCLGEACRPLGYPLNLALGTSQKFNFSSAKLDHINYRNGLTIERDQCGKGPLERIFRAWFEEAVLCGAIPLSKGLTVPRHEWHWPGYEPIDPVQDAQADHERLSNGTDNWQRFWARRGLDWRDVMRQQAAEQKEIDRLGLQFGEPATKSITETTDMTDDGRPVPPNKATAHRRLWQQYVRAKAELIRATKDDNGQEHDDNGRFGEGGGGEHEERTEEHQEHADKWWTEDQDRDEKREKEDAKIETAREKIDEADQKARGKEDEAFESRRDKLDAAEEKRTKSREKEDDKLEAKRDKESKADDKVREQLDAKKEKRDEGREKADEKTAKDRAKEDKSLGAAQMAEDKELAKRQIKENDAETTRREEFAAKIEADHAAATAKIEASREKALDEAADDDGDVDEDDADRINAEHDERIAANDEAKEAAEAEEEAAADAWDARHQKESDEQDAKHQAQAEALEAEREKADAEIAEKREKEDAEHEAEYAANDEAWDKILEAREAEDEEIAAAREEEDAAHEAEVAKLDHEDEAAYKRREAEDNEWRAKWAREDVERDNERNAADVAEYHDRKKQHPEAHDEHYAGQHEWHQSRTKSDTAEGAGGRNRIRATKDERGQEHDDKGRFGEGGSGGGKSTKKDSHPAPSTDHTKPAAKTDSGSAAHSAKSLKERGKAIAEKIKKHGAKAAAVAKKVGVVAKRVAVEASMRAMSGNLADEICETSHDYSKIINAKGTGDWLSAANRKRLAAHLGVSGGFASTVASHVISFGLTKLKTAIAARREGKAKEAAASLYEPGLVRGSAADDLAAKAKAVTAILVAFYGAMGCPDDELPAEADVLAWMKKQARTEAAHA